MNYFEITLPDDSVINERDCSWEELSSDVLIDFLGHQKVVQLAWYPFKKIVIHHGELETELYPNKDEKVYQGYKSVVQRKKDDTLEEHVVGRIVGLVRDGRVTEERFLNELSGIVEGVKI